MTLKISASRFAALVLGAGLVTACVGMAEDRMAHAQTQPEGAFVTLPEGRIHAVIRGQGPDLVMIHGANGNARDFSFDLIDRMAADFRVIALDRPGFGFSDDFGGPDGPVEQADILRAAVAELDVTRPIVLGHSYGGAVALAWALRAGDDVAGLTLLAPASHPWPGDLGLWYRISASALGQHVVLPLVARFAPASAVDSTLDGVFAPNPVPDGYLDHLGRDLTLRAEQLALNAQQVNGLKPHVEAMATGYPALNIPIEVVHGTADETVGMSIHSERLEREVPSVNLTRLDGVGHMPHHARPDAVANAILRTAQRAGLVR
ncbi:alpha/beta fold hydrolase [Roseinatronobacter sp.]|uniref:alpha/beta fold hydrolase n=1 Tax=Roseinatronobacter sp. TaxID=1945755 RepID=UPI003F71AE14